MTQHLFAAETGPTEVNLDANFTELYGVANRFNPSGLLAFSFDSAGNFLSTQTTTGYGASFGCSVEGAVGRFISNHASGASTGSLFLGLAYAGGQIGSITQNGTTGVSFNTSSDYRLKTAVTPIINSGAFIDALMPCTWTWISDGSAGAGFIAHELQAVSPSSVTGSKDAVQDVGTLQGAAGETLATNVPQPERLDAGHAWVKTGTAPIFQSVGYASPEIVSMLVAEVKDLRRRLHVAGL